MRVVASPAFRNRSSNPYNALLYDALVERGVDVAEFDSRNVLAARADIVHFHWPESALNKRRPAAALVRSLQLLALSFRLRRRGVVLVWTAHNLRSHFQRYPRAEALWWRLFTRLLDGWISPAETAAEAAQEAHPRLRALPHAVVPLGHFRDEYPSASGDEVRARFGVGPDDRLLAFIGRIKPYKGVPELLAAFGELERPGVRLLVAGRCDEPELRAELANVDDPRVVIHLEEIPDRDLASFVQAADLVVLPFRAILNSASLLLALSFDRPTLCPDLGALAEVADHVPGWVTLYSGEMSTEVLEAALDAPRPDGQPDLSAFSWPEIARLTESFYERLLHDTRR